MYHVPLDAWAGFISRLLTFVRPGGTCLRVMTARRGPTYELCHDFKTLEASSEQVVSTVRQREPLFSLSAWPACGFCLLGLHAIRPSRHAGQGRTWSPDTSHLMQK